MKKTKNKNKEILRSDKEAHKDLDFIWVFMLRYQGYCLEVNT